MRARSLALVTIVFAIAACTDATAPVAPLATGPTGPSFLISDGAHGGSNSFFFFLPPMVKNPKTGGHNVRGLSPVVDICVGQVTGCSTPLAHFVVGDERRHEREHECREHWGHGHEDGDDDRDGHHGPNAGDRFDDDHHGNKSCDSPPDVCRDDDEDDDDDHDGHQHHGDSEDHYLVDWHTGRSLNPGIYRVSVTLNGQLLGFADVQVVGKGKDLKNVTSDFVGLLRGETLPIKFRIEKGAVDCGGPPPPTTISGTVTLNGALTSGYAVYLLDGSGALLASATTDGTGSYSFPGIVPGAYLVCEADPFVDPLYAAELSPSSGGSCPSPYAAVGYSLTGPAGGNDFVNLSQF